MVIKKVGGPGPVAPAESIEGKQPAAVEGFSRVVGAAETSPSSVTEVAQAVEAVAADVAAGRLPEPQDQVDAVIDRMVRLQAPEGASKRAIDSRVLEVQLALGDHPGFAGRVQSMLAEALRANDA